MSRTPPPAEVVVVGNVGVDTCVYLSGEEFDWSVEADSPPVADDPPVVDTNDAGVGLAVGFLTSYVL